MRKIMTSLEQFQKNVLENSHSKKLHWIHRKADSLQFFLLKVGLSSSRQNSFYLLQWKLFKIFLKIFKFLFWLFGHVEKTAWLER